MEPSFHLTIEPIQRFVLAEQIHPLQLFFQEIFYQASIILGLVTNCNAMINSFRFDLNFRLAELIKNEQIKEVKWDHFFVE